MKDFIFILAFTLLCTIGITQSTDHWRFDTVPAPSLSNNILEDKTERLVEVYLPPDYYTSNQRYPVVYYLGGYNSRNRKPNYQVKKHKELLDEKIENGQVSPVILVLVGGTNRLRGSFYINSPVTGNWGDFVTKDLINYIDGKYRTIPKKESRSLTGSSMGGYGCLNQAMLNPDLFCAAFGMSPGLYEKGGFANSQIVKREGVMTATLELLDWLKPMSDEAARDAYLNFVDTTTNRTLIFVLAYGSAHAPNTNRAPYFDYPFKIENGDTIINQEIWNKWQNGFGGIDHEIEKYGKNLEQLKLYGIACGHNEGNKWIYNGSLYYSQKLIERKITHELFMHQGTHTSHTVETLINHVIPTFVNLMEY